MFFFSKVSQSLQLTDMKEEWFNQENKWSKSETYCILCLSLGQAGQSSPLQNSEWQLSTWSHCYHIPYIQSGNLSANNYKNKPLLEPLSKGQQCFLHHPQTDKPDPKLYSLVDSPSSPTQAIPSSCFFMYVWGFF